MPRFLRNTFSHFPWASEPGRETYCEVKVSDDVHAPCPPGEERRSARRGPGRCRSHDKNVLQSGHRAVAIINGQENLKSDLVPDGGFVGTCCTNCRSGCERWTSSRATAPRCGRLCTVEATCDRIASPPRLQKKKFTRPADPLLPCGNAVGQRHIHLGPTQDGVLLVITQVISSKHAQNRRSITLGKNPLGGVRPHSFTGNTQYPRGYYLAS